MPSFTYISENEVAICRELRFATYRNITLWIYGRLGRKVRRVLPSCVVTAILRVSVNNHNSMMVDPFGHVWDTVVIVSEKRFSFSFSFS